MTENEFIDKTYKLAHYIKCNEKSTCYIGTITKDVSDFILDNPDNDIVIKFVRDTVNYILELFNNDIFNDNLNKFNNLFYRRQIEICNFLKLHINNEYGNCACYLKNLFNIPWEYNDNIFIETLYILNHYSSYLSNNLIERNFRDFMNNNRIVSPFTLENYYKDLDEEKKFYNDPQGKEIIDYGYINHVMDCNAVKIRYMNKRIGNIGEFYTLDRFKKFGECIFASKDLSELFGYDIYFLDKYNIENLLEVKTTTNSNNGFFISENELSVALESKVKGAKYVLCRVVLDSLLNPSFSFLNLTDEETFCQIDKPDGKLYKRDSDEDGKILFKKYR